MDVNLEGLFLPGYPFFFDAPCGRLPIGLDVFFSFSGKRSTAPNVKKDHVAKKKKKTGDSGLSTKAERELLSNFLNKAFTDLYKRKKYIEVLTPLQAKQVAYESADKKGSVTADINLLVKIPAGGTVANVQKKTTRNLVAFTRALSGHVLKTFAKNLFNE